jgi:hypothetical protein
MLAGLEASKPCVDRKLNAKNETRFLNGTVRWSFKWEKLLALVRLFEGWKRSRNEKTTAISAPQLSQYLDHTRSRRNFPIFHHLIDFGFTLDHFNFFKDLLMQNTYVFPGNIIFCHACPLGAENILQSRVHRRKCVEHDKIYFSDPNRTANQSFPFSIRWHVFNINTRWHRYKLSVASCSHISWNPDMNSCWRELNFFHTFLRIRINFYSQNWETCQTVVAVPKLKFPLEYIYSSHI